MWGGSFQSHRKALLTAGYFFMNGWIKLHRQIIDHWIWKDEKKLKWWIDLLIMANHEEKKMPEGYKLFVCQRGQIITSLGNLSFRWKVGRETVRSFLSML